MQVDNLEPSSTHSVQIDTSRDQAALHFRKAVEHYGKNDLLSAIRELEEVLTYDPGHESASQRLDYYRQEHNGIIANEKVLRERVANAPNDWENVFDLADTLYVLGNHCEAIEHWQNIANNATGFW